MRNEFLEYIECRGVAPPEYISTQPGKRTNISIRKPLRGDIYLPERIAEEVKFRLIIIVDFSPVLQ